MDVLPYAQPDYDQNNNRPAFELSRPRLSDAAWERLGRDTGATIIPFSFWRSRLRKLLTVAGPWTIAFDEVGSPYHLRGRVLFRFAAGPFGFEISTGSQAGAAPFTVASMPPLRDLARPMADAYFDAHCTVLTDFPHFFCKVLPDLELRQQILSHPPFDLRCQPQWDDSGMLILATPPGNDVRFTMSSMTSLLHSLLNQLHTASLATLEPIRWTLGV